MGSRRFSIPRWRRRGAWGGTLATFHPFGLSGPKLGVWINRPACSSVILRRLPLLRKSGAPGDATRPRRQPHWRTSGGGSFMKDVAPRPGRTRPSLSRWNEVEDGVSQLPTAGSRSRCLLPGIPHIWPSVEHLVHPLISSRAGPTRSPLEWNQSRLRVQCTYIKCSYILVGGGGDLSTAGSRRVGSVGKSDCECDGVCVLARKPGVPGNGCSVEKTAPDVVIHVHTLLARRKTSASGHYQRKR